MRAAAPHRPPYWVTLLTVCLGYFMASLAMNPVTSILPTITQDLGVSVTGASWIMTAYFLMLVGLVLVMGRLGDVYGHGRVFTLGIALFTLGQLLCGLVPSFLTLLAARGVQGIGSAMIFGTSLAIIASAIPGAHRGRAIGVLTMTSSISALLGVWVATWSVEHLSWHWAFLLPAPVGLLGVLLGLRLPGGGARGTARRVDWAGAAWLFATLTAALLGLNHLHEGSETFQDGAPYHVGMHVLAAVLFVGFLRVEQRAAAPLLSFKLLREARFSSGILGNSIAHMSMLATGFLIPFLLERGRQLTPADTRELLMLQQVAMVTSSLLLGYLYDRCRSPVIGLLMMASIAGGLLTLGLVGGTLPYVALIMVAVVLGAGLGGFTTVNNTAIMTMAPSDQRGFASGLVETSRQFGHTVGVSLSSSIMGAALAGAAPLPPQYVDGFQQAALVMGIVASLGVAALIWPHARRLAAVPSPALLSDRWAPLSGPKSNVPR